MHEWRQASRRSNVTRETYHQINLSLNTVFTRDTWAYAAAYQIYVYHQCIVVFIGNTSIVHHDVQATKAADNSLKCF